MGPVRVNRTAFVHQVEHHFGIVQEDESLTDDMEVGDGTCATKKNQHKGTTRWHIRTVFLCPPFSVEPEFLGGEISHVSDCGERLRTRGKWRDGLWFGEPTVEGVGDGERRGEKRRGEHVVERHRRARRSGGKDAAKKEDSDWT